MEVALSQKQDAGDLEKETLALLEEKVELYDLTYETRFLTILCC